MSAGALLVTLGGLVVSAGSVGVVAAVRGITLLPTHTRSPGGPRWRVSRLHLIGLVVGVGVLSLTGWPVAAIATAVAVVFVPSLLGGGTAAKLLIAKSEALADWTRRLADLISSGAAGSTTDALQRSLNSAPDPIAEQVRRLVSRMARLGTESALRRFADEVNDPAAEKIAGVLILRERNGGPGLADVLTGLAIDLDERSRMIRDVESERAKPRSNMRTIVVVTGALILGMTLFAHTFLLPYSSLFGQLMLLAVAAIFAIALRWMRTLSNSATAPRVLTRSDTAVGQ